MKQKCLPLILMYIYTQADVHKYIHMLTWKAYKMSSTTNESVKHATSRHKQILAKSSIASINSSIYFLSLRKVGDALGPGAGLTLLQHITKQDQQCSCSSPASQSLSSQGVAVASCWPWWRRWIYTSAEPSGAQAQTLVKINIPITSLETERTLLQEQV